jgi:hypothetical protein
MLRIISKYSYAQYLSPPVEQAGPNICIIFGFTTNLRKMYAGEQQQHSDTWRWVHGDMRSVTNVSPAIPLFYITSALKINARY